MASALTPDQALEQLLELSPDIRAAVVLDDQRRRLAGRRSLAGEARELLAATDAPEIEVGAGRGSVFASRTEHAAVAVVAARSALPALMLYDLRSVLSRLGPE